jgi:5'-nucleotidase (lipoprotein e(P4) family)
MIPLRTTALCAFVLLGGCAAQTAQMAPAAAPPPVVASAAAPVTLDSPAPDPMRWTYGSGEAAAASIQAYRALADYAIATAAKKPATSIPMGLPDVVGGVATTSCSGKKPAVVFDVDETVILNRGYEYWLTLGNSYKPAEFDAWARDGAKFVASVPGAITGIRRLRDAGITVIYNTNRPSNAAEGTSKALDAVGIGGAVHGETLFLSGDDALGGNKDGRRKTISDRFCVVALAGDNLGDFAEALNDKALAPLARRQMTARGNLAQLWGNGWFLIPNAAYGAWQKGTIGDVFPPDARWEPKSEGSK